MYRYYLDKLYESNAIRQEIGASGWVYFPEFDEGAGHLPAEALRAIADDLDSRNKPFLDALEEYHKDEV